MPDHAHYIHDLSSSEWQLKGYWPHEWELSPHNPFRPMERGVTPWIPATVPGSINRDLLEAGLIEDPYRGLNSQKCEWTWQRNWLYRRTFHLSSEIKRSHARLEFQGVDYHCRIYLNGHLLGEHEGMFTSFEYDVTDLLNWDEDNEIHVGIWAAPDELGQIGKTEDTHTLKTRFTYKWDFATRLVNLGIWNPVRLHLFDTARITGIHARPLLNDALDRGELKISTTLDATRSANVTLETVLSRGGKTIEKTSGTHAVSPGQSVIDHSLCIANPSLWWPNGFGEASLYDLTLRVFQDGHAVSEAQTAIGFRKIEFRKIEGTGEDVFPYQLVVNHVPICIQGFNYVPVDHMYGPDFSARQDWLTDWVVLANGNLIRVWGGGLIEKDAFYDLCDRKGILIWQDFILSSSGVSNKPPRDPAVLQTLRIEMEAGIRRIRNHPCLALWCGGNELTDENHVPVGKEEPAVALLDEIVRNLDPDRLFMDTNPTGPVFGLDFGTLDSGKRMDDVHGPWTYMGDPGHYSLYNRCDALFQSEYGCVGTSNMRALRNVAPEEDLFPVHGQHPIWLHHGAWWIHDHQVREYFGDVPNLERFVECSQFLQFEGLRYSVEANRRRVPRFAGGMIWQLNEPWPTTACTNLIDYFGRPKAAYFGVANAYRPVTGSLRYNSIRIQSPEDTGVCFVSNLGSEPFEGEVTATVLDATGNVIRTQAWPVEIEPLRSLELGKVVLRPTEVESVISFVEVAVFQAKANPRTPKVSRVHRCVYVFSSKQETPLAPLWELTPTLLEVEDLDYDPKTGKGTICFQNDASGIAFRVRMVTDHMAAVVRPVRNYIVMLPGETARVAFDVAGIQGREMPDDEVNLVLWAWNAPPKKVSLIPGKRG